jgi:hypothetical protein
MRPRADRRVSAELEPIGEISAERFVAVGRSDGQADLVALRGDGTALHARAGREGTVGWRELAAKLSDTPAALHGPDGALHIFGLDDNGACARGRGGHRPIAALGLLGARTLGARLVRRKPSGRNPCLCAT